MQNSNPGRPQDKLTGPRKTELCYHCRAEAALHLIQTGLSLLKLYQLTFHTHYKSCIITPPNGNISN